MWCFCVTLPVFDVFPHFFGIASSASVSLVCLVLCVLIVCLFFSDPLPSLFLCFDLFFPPRTGSVPPTWMRMTSSQVHDVMEEMKLVRSGDDGKEGFVSRDLSHMSPVRPQVLIDPSASWTGSSLTESRSSSPDTSSICTSSPLKRRAGFWRLGLSRRL